MNNDNDFIENGENIGDEGLKEALAASEEQTEAITSEEVISEASAVEQSFHVDLEMDEKASAENSIETRYSNQEDVVSQNEKSYGQFMYNSNQDDYVWNSNVPPIEKKPKKTSGIKIALAIVAAIAVVVIGATTITIGINKLNNSSSGSNRTQIDSTKVTESETTSVEKTTVDTSTNTNTSEGVVITDVSNVVEAVMPSIVAITSTTKISSGSYGWWYGEQEQEATGAGSGIIIEQTETELLIVTNNHVVEGATSLSVQFINDVSVEATIKGTDSENDLAVVAIPLDKIDDDTLSAIKKAALGDSTTIKAGAGVIAIGNALGYGQSVTTGVISATDREVEVDDGLKMTMLQTDAAINGGNSGGALLNVNGEVVGINAAKYSSSSYSTSSIEGMGFAIPISSAKDIINELMSKETRTKVAENKRGYLGISGLDIDSQTAENYAMPVGVMVSKVTEGGAAEKAGIEAKDVIVKLGDEKITSYVELKEALSYYAVGDTVTVTIKYAEGKEYKEKEVEVTLQSN